VRATVEVNPFTRGYEIRMATGPAESFAVAVGLDPNGQVIYEGADPGGEIKPLIRLSFDEWDAIARALGETTQTSDATRDALEDVRKTRDRLLSIVEVVMTNPPA
jgi:hypothetical protein